MKNSQMAAMPTQVNGGDVFGGLTKLEHFAGLAMQGSLAGDLDCCATAKQVATASVEYARALLAELEKQQ